MHLPMRECWTVKKLQACAERLSVKRVLRHFEKLLGSPRRTKKVSGCYGDGQEYMLEYTSFWVNTYKDKKGKEIVLDVISK